MFNSSIRLAIKKRAKELQSSISPDEIFQSPALAKSLKALNSYLMHESRTAEIDIAKGQAEGDVAYTTGSYIYINYNTNLLERLHKDIEGWYLGIMGLFFHEKAHDKFLDFDQEAKAAASLRQGEFYGIKPMDLTPKETDDWAEMEDALRNGTSRELFVEIFHDLSNIFSDCHDEEALIDEYGTYVSEPIYLTRNQLRASTKPLEDKLSELKGKKYSKTMMFSNLLFSLARFGTIPCKKWETVENNEIGKAVLDLEPHILIASVTDDTTRKYYEMNFIMMKMWQFIREDINEQRQNQSGDSQSSNSQNSQNGNSQNGSSQGNGSQGNNSQGNSSQGNSSELSSEEVKELLDALKNAHGKQGNAPTGKSSETAKQKRREAKQNPGAAEEKAKQRKQNQQNSQGQSGGANSSNASQAISNILNDVASSIATEQAEAEIEQANSSQTLITVKAANATSAHKDIPLYASRVVNYTKSDVAKYNRIMSNIRSISKRLQKKIYEALRDLCNGYVTKHRIYGKTFCPEDAYRPDNRFFSSRKMPQDLPDMALEVLVDNSGSMQGVRLNTAVEACSLLYDFATGINIPVAVCGHRTRGSGVDFNIFADFEKISDKDKYRICGMQSGGCNRDGMALNIAVDMLNKRPEQVKLLIIISDGQPYHVNYGGEKAAKDIQQVIKSAKHKGVEIIAAAIGDDRENIKPIYGDTYLDISDLNKMPKTLTEIVRKRVMANI